MDKDIATIHKCRIVNALVFPVELCGFESCMMRNAERRRMNGQFLGVVIPTQQLIF